jgi:archaellum component FlaC
MATVLFNPTNEDLEGQYIGETTVIPIGGKVKVDDRRARHLLNNLGPRGLVSLDFGDEGEGERKKAEMGRKRNFDFKYRHVINFNQNNEQREQRKLGYIKPDEQTQRYADEVGVDLVQPYRPESQVAERVGALSQELEDKKRALEEKDKEVDDLKSTVKKLSDQMQTFMDMMGQATEVDEASAGVKKKMADAEAETEKITEETKQRTVIEIRKKYNSLNAKIFMPWVYNNLEEIPDYPDQNQKEIGQKWAKYYGTPFPTEVPEEFRKAG